VLAIYLHIHENLIDMEIKLIGIVKHQVSAELDALIVYFARSEILHPFVNRWVDLA
jgi:hypothetical protein